MLSALPLAQVLTFSFALWFGLYLLARQPDKVGLRFAGLGLLAYALGIGLDTLIPDAPGLLRFRTPLLFLPPLFWLGATRQLLPDAVPDRRLDSLLLLSGLVAYGVGVIAESAGIDVFIGGAALLLSAWALYRVGRSLPGGQPRRPFLILFTGALFFLLSNGALLLPRAWLASDWVVAAIGLDLALLAYLLVVLDAYDEGEALLPDVLRSLGASLLSALVFGGQVLLVMVITEDMTLPLRTLLLAVIATALALQTLSDPLYRLLDRLLLAHLPGVQRERARLQGAARALPRLDSARRPLDFNDDEFTRLTRRALSHLGDPGRLASSPLMRLPAIDRRLADLGLSDGSLERAAELRALLVEQIDRLKPRGDSHFGTTDEWRYYNALYFPYVAGLKPFSRHDLPDDLPPEFRAALDWFRTAVPERTLYNWQNAAARLIAQALREESPTE